MTTRFVLIVSVAAGLTVGCGGRTNPAAPASLHGKVTYNGAPVTGGVVTVHGPNNAGRYSLAIDAQGNYAGTDLPAGECTLTVSTEGLNPAAQAAKKRNYGGSNSPDQIENYQKKMFERMGKTVQKDASPEEGGKYVKIPARYADSAKSPLHVTLTSGDQKQDLELTD